MTTAAPGERRHDRERDGGERGQHERVGAIAGEVLARRGVQAAERAEREAEPEDRAPTVLSRVKKPMTMHTIPIRTLSSTSGNGCQGAFGRSSSFGVGRGARGGTCGDGALGTAAALGLVVPAHRRRGYFTPPILVGVPRNDPTDTGGLFIGRRPGTGPVHYRGDPSAAGRAGSGPTACSRRCCWCSRRCSAYRSGARSRWPGCGSARRPTTSRLAHAGHRRRLRGHPRLADGDLVAGVAAGPRVADRPPRRRARAARRRAAADLRRHRGDRAGRLRDLVLPDPGPAPSFSSR